MNVTQFRKLFPTGLQIPYDRKLQQEIEVRRKDAGGQLFIDKVLRALNMTKAKYPPKNDTALRQLHQQICEASISQHYKLSLIYYIFLDYDLTNADPLPSEAFAASGIPRSYQIFMKGLWHMDREEFSDALEYISHPSLIADFADDIITALVERAPADDYSLALSYYYAVQPSLKSSKALESLFTAIVRTNVAEALFYSRTHPEHVRGALFRQLIAQSLEGAASPSQVEHELAFLPLEKVEEAWLEEYLITGEGRNLRKGKDTLLVRKIASDQFGDIRNVKASGQWGPVLEGIKAGISGQNE